MLKNKILDRNQDLTISSEDSVFEKSNIENVRDIFYRNTVPSEGKKNTEYLDKVIKIENMDDTETSSKNKYESYQSCVKGIKRKADTCSIVSVKIKQKLSNSEPTSQLSKNSTAGVIESLVSVKIKKHNISTSEQHIQPAKNLTAEPLQLKKAVCNNVKESKSEEKFDCSLSDSRKNFCKQVPQTQQSIPTLENVTAEPLESAVWNNDKNSESGETFDCCLPGCKKQFRKQKIYETHIKHFHGVFNFEKSEPIITALFYDCRKKGDDKLACKKKVKEKFYSKSSAKLKDVETENSDIRSTLLPSSSFDYKLPSKFSDSEILLPNSLIRSIDLISAGKMMTEVICEEKKLPLNFLNKDFYPIKSVSLNKRGLNLENDNENISGSCKKTNLSSKLNFQEKFSSVRSDNIKLLGDKNAQHSSNNASVRVPVLSNTGDSLISTITQENNEKSISDIKNSIQEDHIYASKKLDGEFVNQKIDAYKNNSVLYSHYKLNEKNDKIKNPSIDTNKLVTGSDIHCGNASTLTVCSYEKFVKKKERECLDLDSSLSNKFSILEVINQKGNANNQDKISTAVSLILHNMTHNPSFGLMPNLNTEVSQNTQIASKSVDFIRRIFEFCNCARNLKDILFKCKQILHRLSEYSASEDKNISLLPCAVDTEKCDKLLHYVFFLDVIRDPSFASTYVQHILKKPDLAVLNKLTNPVSLYLTNTEKELPNVKLRRDREFLQRNSDFFTVLLKIQKSCHILPYSNSSISAEELCRPTTNLRLEKSDYFAQVFCHVKSEKDPIFLQSYGVNKDLSVSPFVECVCDDYYVHKLAGFVLLPRPDSFVTKDMCVGLCFESTTFSFRHLVIQLSLIAEEVKKIISEIREELCKESTQHCLSDMANNLLIIFNLIDTETDSVFSSLDLVNNFVNELPTLENKSFWGEIKVGLIKHSIKEIINIIEKLKDLKECDTIS